MMPNIDSAGARIFKSYWYALELPRHLYHFSPKSISHLAKSVGLRELSLTTGRELFVEQSTYYLVDELFKKLSVSRRPLSDATKPGIPWRIVRKGFRLTVLPVLTALGGLAGDGEGIHVILQKD